MMKYQYAIHLHTLYEDGEYLKVSSCKMRENKMIGHSGALEDRRLNIIK